MLLKVAKLTPFVVNHMPLSPPRTKTNRLLPTTRPVGDEVIVPPPLVQGPQVVPVVPVRLRYQRAESAPRANRYVLPPKLTASTPALTLPPSDVHWVHTLATCWRYQTALSAPRA